MIRKIYSDGFFDVNEKNGFLPIKEPMRYLPELYKSLQILIDDLPILKDEKIKGILSFKGEVEKRVADLTNFKNEVTLEKDPFIIQALFRCYAFITSSFTLAPAHFYFLENNKYGKANVFLPKQIAEPFSIVAKKLDVYPFLDYHYAYSLGNYYKIDDKGGLNWENLGMACSFSGMDDERGFIMLHVDINQHSPNLVKSVIDAQNSNSDKQLNKALDLGYKTMIKINERRQLMWTASRWEHYNGYQRE
jgi:indoleamine 2,3-dioxygenase